MARIVGVDGLRACAALAVFICHINGYWGFLDLPGKLPQLMEIGAHGVDLFVVISGFCLALPLVKSRLALDLRPFLGRRALRILPPYFIALTIAAALAMIPQTSHLVVGRQATWADLAAHVFVVQTWFPSTIGTINGSLWSVSLEVQLYVVFPLLVLAWRRFGFGYVLAASALLSVLWSAGSYIPSAHAMLGGVLGTSAVLPDRLVQFVAGSTCAAVWAAGRVPATRYLIGGLVVGGLAAGLASTAGIGLGNSLLWSIPSASAVLLITRSVGDVLSRTPLDGFGRTSYSFYLLHQPIILLMAVPVALIPGGWPVQLVVGGSICLALAWFAGWVLYRTVEKPSHDFGRRRFGRASAAPAPGTESSAFSAT